MNIAIYGVGHLGEIMYQHVKSFTKNGSINISYFIETVKTREEFHNLQIKKMLDINPDEFDILIIAVAAFHEVLKVLSEHPRWADILPKVRNMSQIDYLLTESSKSIMPYKSVSLSNDIKYISTTNDLYIGEAMYMTGKNYAEEQIEDFFHLMNEYCDFESKSGYFLDIGANIGTTCIYAKKLIAPELRYIGFEAGKENYKLFKCNCILNDVEDIIAENQALGEKECKGKYSYNELNPGGSGVVFSNDSDSDMDVIALDEYIQKNSIEKTEVRCIWLDTEGCEAEILLGAQELLSIGAIPLMQEFNPSTYEKRGKSEAYYDLMETTYHYFIDVENRGCKYEIHELRNYMKTMQRKGKNQADIFFF